MTRPIPSSGERLPVVGIGTAVIFDYQNDPAKQATRAEVIRRLIAGGGRLIDTAPAYGSAEERLGEIVAELGVRDRLFLATKFSFGLPRAEAEASLRASLRRLRSDRVELMQAWNVTDGGYALDLPREWKRAGLCRYVGITTSQVRSYDAMAKVLTREKPDFLQVNYSLGALEAEKTLLPAARDVGAAVLVNLPFGRNSLFRKAGNRPLPDFAAESARGPGRSSSSSSSSGTLRSPPSFPAPTSRSTCSTTWMPAAAPSPTQRCGAESFSTGNRSPRNKHCYVRAWCKSSKVQTSIPRPLPGN